MRLLCGSSGARGEGSCVVCGLLVGVAFGGLWRFVFWVLDGLFLWVGVVGRVLVVWSFLMVVVVVLGGRWTVGVERGVVG